MHASQLNLYAVFVFEKCMHLKKKQNLTLEFNVYVSDFF
jgi:hypothetical protein